MMTRPHSPIGARLGIDENGLGPRLGPLIVTAALAKVNQKGATQLVRPLPPSLRVDLDDSKRLLSCGKVALGEAWARLIVERQSGIAAKKPSELFRLLALESESSLRQDCPKEAEAQCWHLDGEAFSATGDELQRVAQHLITLEKLGIEVRALRCDVVCTGRLNHLKEQGVHRFMADLHAMERLILRFREESSSPLLATCGKVGGIGKYAPYFGPLSGRLHSVIKEGRERSCYFFPDLGEIRFVRDADALDPLVMLASMVGKYLRELLMGRISKFYAELLDDPNLHPSGYHDPVTDRFVKRTEAVRARLKIADDCFQRRPALKRSPAKKRPKKPRSRS